MNWKFWVPWMRSWMPKVKVEFPPLPPREEIRNKTIEKDMHDHLRMSVYYQQLADENRDTAEALATIVYRKLE